MASKVDGYIGKINPGDGINYAIGSTAYGYCETVAQDADKVVNMTGFVLETGATIYVKFKYANTASSVLTLNVNGTGAKYIRISETYIVVSGYTKIVGYLKGTYPKTWQEGQVVSFTYDGTYWLINGSGITEDNARFYLSASYASNVYSNSASTSGNTYLHVYKSTSHTSSSGVNYGENTTAGYIHLVPGDNMEITGDGNHNVTFNSPGQILIYDIASFSSLPQTVTDSLITADHVLLRSELGTPTAQASDWTVTTAAGSLTVSGTMASSSSTTMRLVLGIPANPPAST